MLTRFAKLPKITEMCDFEETPLAAAVRMAMQLALVDTSKLTGELLAIPGMSGRRYRHFINNLVEIVENPRYLEIGCWAGSTMCAAIYGNKLRAFGIDNWSEFGGPSQQFLQRVGENMSESIEFNMLTQDFRKVDYNGIGKFNIYLFDGPHSETDQFDGVRIALPALDEEYVLIVDDWNWGRVRMGTLNAIRDAQLQVIYTTEIRTTLDDSHAKIHREKSDWHNGYYIAVLRKPKL